MRVFGFYVGGPAPSLYYRRRYGFACAEGSVAYNWDGLNKCWNKGAGVCHWLAGVRARFSEACRSRGGSLHDSYDRGFRNVSGRRWEQRLRRVWAQPQGNMNIKEGVGLEKPVRSNMEHQPPKRPIAFLFSGS